jgi:hypothetical protein
MALENLEKRLRARAKRAAKRSNPAARAARKKAAAAEDSAELPRWLRRLLILGGSLTLLVVAVGLFLIFFYTSGGRDVSVTVTLPTSVVRGAPFDVQVDVINSTGAALQGGTIELDLPAGLVNYGGPNPSSISDDVGTVGTGSLSKKTYSLLPVGNVGSAETVDAVLNYSSGGGTQFNARGTAQTTIQGQALNVSATPPSQILAGSSFSLPVTYENDSDFAFPAVALSANYPDGFKFDSSDVAPESLNNYWQLGALAPHASGTLTIVGHLAAGSGSGVTLPLTLAATFNGTDFPVAETAVALNPSPAPVGLTVLVNGANAYVARVGDTLNYAIDYQNLSGIALSNATIKATLLGDLLDFGTIATDGQFNAGTQTVTWSAATDPGLALIAPGASGEVDLKIKLKDQLSAARLNEKNYSVQISVIMASPTVPPYLSASRTTAQAIVPTKISGLVSVSASGFYRDAPSGIVNAGSLPPQVGQTTDYTIHWDITNFTTDLNNVTVSAALPPGVVWTGQVKSNVSSLPTYSSSSDAVTWVIPSVPAGRGILSDPVEAVFQVAATPPADFIGQYEPLLGPTSLSASDSFTGLTLQSQDAPVTTALPSDPTVGQSQGMVVQ